MPAVGKRGLVLGAAVVESLRHLVVGADLRERCGFLVGNANASEITATSIVPVLNVAATADRFAIPDHERRRARLHARGRGRQLVALYHTHASSEARLSERDHDQLRVSDIAWVVLGVERGQVVAVGAFAAGNAAPMGVTFEQEKLLVATQ